MNLHRTYKNVNSPKIFGTLPTDLMWLIWLKFTSCSFNDQIHNYEGFCPHRGVTFIFWRGKGNHKMIPTEHSSLKNARSVWSSPKGYIKAEQVSVKICESVPTSSLPFSRSNSLQRENWDQNHRFTRPQNTVIKKKKKKIRSRNKNCFYLWKYAFIHCRTASWTFQVLNWSLSHIRLQTSSWKRAADTMWRASADSSQLRVCISGTHQSTCPDIKLM